MIPDYLTVANPVDNGAQFLVTAPVEDRKRVFDLDRPPTPNVDVIVIGLTGALGRLTDRFAEDIVAFIDEVTKPIVVTWNSFKTDEQGFTTLIDAGVPMFRSFRNCFAALRAFARYQEASADVPGPQEPCRAGSRQRRPRRARRGAGGRPLPSGPTPRAGCSSPSASPWPARAWRTRRPEAARIAEDIGFPVVMKIASPDFPHKSDAGLVRLRCGQRGRGQGRLHRARGSGPRGPSARPASRACRSNSRSRAAPR